jgi:hypothetical protein
MSQRSGSHFKHRQRLYDEYESVCWLCLKPNASEIDHVIPVSQGGSDEYVNLRLAHKSCNVRRNRHNHPFNQAPFIAEHGFPDRWHHVELHPDMWRDDFTAKARMLASRAREQDLEDERSASEARRTYMESVKKKINELHSEITGLNQQMVETRHRLVVLEKKFPGVNDRMGNPVTGYILARRANFAMLMLVFGVAIASYSIAAFAAENGGAKDVSDWVLGALGWLVLCFFCALLGLVILGGIRILEYLWTAFNRQTAAGRSIACQRAEIGYLRNELVRSEIACANLETKIDYWESVLQG